MSDRPVRSLEKLYDLNNILFEMASVVERSSRIQGPFEESDFEHQRMSPGKFTDQNRVMFSGDTRVESGTCNVCSAPCSSCMHRRAVAMETSVDCGSSDTTFLRKEGDNCSFNGVNHRSCNELRTAASETSNLLSGSSNDSCCENAESKATLRDSFTCDNSEAVDMLPEVSTVKTIKEETFSEKRISDVGFEMSCTDSRVMQDGEFDEGHRMSTCHKNNDSCTSEATYGNMLDLDLDKRDTPCSSLSTPKCSTKETEMMIQVEKVTHESRVCLTEANMINSTKLNGLLREPFHKKSPGPINVNFSTKSDLSNPSSRKNILSKLTSNSPSLSNHISSENPEDSIDLDATKPSNFQGASHECLVVKDEASARDLLSTDNEVSKSIHIKSGAPSLESKNEEQCAISATDFGRPEYSLHTSETQLQPILDGRASDLDNMLYDVKVCDICGDAGREELLATCSRCVDGAEHTYCMRIMLDKVPEGDWFCEECQLKEKIATRKLNEAEPKFGTSSVPSLNKKIQNLGNFTNIESSRKLVVGSSIPETSASIKEMESPRITSKRHVDQVDDSSTARKKVSEPKYESTKLATPKVDTVFSRVGSSRNLHVAEAKGGSATLSSESRRTNVSRTFSFSLKLDSRGNAFKNLHVAEATRSSKNSSPVGQSTNSWTLSRSPGSLSRQISFRKNFEPKVKKLMEGVPRNLAKDSTSKDKKMLAVARRQLSKSASFNSVSSEHQNIGTIIKAQSFKSRLEDPLVLKPIKERNISFVSDYPDVVQPPNKRMHLPKMDSKTAVPTRDLNNKFESNTLDGGRSENNSGYNEAKKQSSFKCERHGIYDSEDKRAGDLIKNKATQADSGATDTSYKEVGRVTNNVSLADCSLQVQSDDKVIVTSSPGASRAPNSVIKPVLVHDKPKETIHSSQRCEIDRLASTAAKPSVVVSLVEGTTKKNKWKDAAIAAMLERKRSRTVDQSESMSNNIIYEGPSQSTLTNSSCQKDLPLVGAGASSGKEVVRDSYSDCSKTEGADVQQIKHSMESSYVPAVEGTTKKNKWKDAAKAAMLERKRSRTVDQSESMSNNIIYEGPSQSTLTNSSCQKDLPLVGAGASSGKEVVRDSYSDYSKTDGADVQQIKHSMESSYVPAVEGTTKKNKWKDAAKAAMLERKRSRTVDQSESMSNNIINEGPSQSTLTNSSCQKDLPLVGAGASCGKEVVRDSYTDYSKTDGADVQQIKHSMESSYVPAVEGTTKKNKWKDAGKAAMLERKRSRTVDQSESMSNNIIYEGPSQSILTNSSCQKDLPLVQAGASCGKEVVGDSYADYSKTDGADVQQIKHSMESSYVPAVEGTTKKNKWKDAAKAAMLERKRSRTVDQSESMSNNIINEGPSQSTLTNSSCQKDLPLVGAGASCGKEVVRDSYTDYSKTDGADVQQIKHSMESSYVPAVEGTTKKNKWKDAGKAAMLERKRSRTVDQSESMSNNIIYEGPSQSILTNSSCQKDLPLVQAGASCGKEVVGDSYADYSKTDGADVQQIKHSMESSYVPAVVDLNADPTIIHDSIEKSTIQILSDHPSLFTTTCRALAIPEHEFIWQGAFEILRIGRLPETVDGIQAHLSNVSSPKVHELACQFPCKIQLEEVPRVSLWPLQFQDIGPEENDIALYFFAKDAESYEKSYQKLLEAAVNNDLALKGNINEMELLIFPSSMLPASSQRWNMLFFLWGIFRVRKSDSSIPCPSLRERPCGTKTTAEPHDEDVSPSPACELSTFQQPNSQRYPPKEVSRSNESCGASRMKHDSSVDCHAVSSTSPENNIHRVEDLHYKSVAETETTDLSVDSSHSCSKSYSFNQKERCSAEEIYETKLGNKNTEFDLARVPLINTKDEHKLSKSSPGYSIASCFREDEEIKKGRLVKIEAESEVKLTDGVCPSWVSRPNRKRALSCSETISGEVSESTKAIMWQPKESCFVCTEDDRDLKRMNCNSEGPASNNCRVASVERNFPSSTRCPYEQRSDDANYNNVIESTKCPERCFFPVDSHRVGSDAVENFRFFLPPVNEESPDSSIPDLELALGGKKSSSRKQTVSLFSPSVDRGKLGKLSGSIFDDDDMSEALSLSLAFPSVDRKRTDDTEQKDQPTVNTHLFLFGGFTDA